MAAANAEAAVFVAQHASRRLIGFAEASLRRDDVIGCDTTPVAYLEGLSVDPSFRRMGVARALVAKVADWGAALGRHEAETADGVDGNSSERVGQGPTQITAQPVRPEALGSSTLNNMGPGSIKPGDDGM